MMIREEGQWHSGRCGGLATEGGIGEGAGYLWWLLGTRVSVWGWRSIWYHQTACFGEHPRPVLHQEQISTARQDVPSSERTQLLAIPPARLNIGHLSWVSRSCQAKLCPRMHKALGSSACTTKCFAPFKHPAADRVEIRAEVHDRTRSF